MKAERWTFCSRRRSPARSCSRSFPAFAPSCSNRSIPTTGTSRFGTSIARRRGRTCTTRPMPRLTPCTPAWACSASSRGASSSASMSRGNVSCIRSSTASTTTAGSSAGRHACTAVIPPCAGEQRNDLHAVCSNGPHVFRHDHRTGPLPRAAGARRKTVCTRVSVSGLLCARQLRGNQRHGDRHVGKRRRPGIRLQQRQLVRELRAAADRSATRPESLRVRRAPMAAAARRQRLGVQPAAVRALRLGR